MLLALLLMQLLGRPPVCSALCATLAPCPCAPAGDGPPATVVQEEERVAAALVHSFEAVDREIMTRCRLEGTKGGATALAVLRVGSQLFAAHAGDTRAVLSRHGSALR